MIIGRINFLLIFLFLFTLSCKKEEDIIKNSDGVIVRQPYLWASSLSKENILSYNIRVNVINNNQVLTMEVEKKEGKPFGNNYLLMKNIEGGKNVWKWDDRLTDFESEDISFVYQNNQYLTFTNGPRNYGIDLSTGQTLWKKEDMDQYSLNVLGIGEIYYVSGNTKQEAVVSRLNDGIFEGNIHNGKQIFVVTPNYSKTYINESSGYKYAIGGSNWAMPFIMNLDTLLLISYQELRPPGPPYLQTDQAQPFICLYNKSQRKWIYENVELAQPAVSQGVDGLPIRADGLVYMAVNRMITCHEVLTGKQVWTQTFDANFLFSGFIKVGNKILANNEGTYLYALDAQTGKRLWQVKSPGTCTKMQELNGVVYFVGGGDGLLYAVDADSGKVYWKIASPDKSKNSGAFFYNMCSVAPGVNGKKGRVVVSSGLNAFCYEAVR